MTDTSIEDQRKQGKAQYIGRGFVLRLSFIVSDEQNEVSNGV